MLFYISLKANTLYKREPVVLLYTQSCSDTDLTERKTNSKFVYVDKTHRIQSAIKINYKMCILINLTPTAK